jgi:anti-sigma factor RsiW
MPHPDESLLHAWLDGELDAADVRRVEALVASDPAWAAAAAEARGLVAAPRWWMVRVAALAVIVAGTTIVLRRGAPELASRAPAARSIAAEPPIPAPMAAAKAARAPVTTESRKKETLQRQNLKEGLAASSGSGTSPRADSGMHAPSATVAALFEIDPSCQVGHRPAS